MTQTITTHNRFVPGERLTLALVDGPFQRLAGEWLFEQLGGVGSKVTLVLNFEFSNTVLSAAFRRGFAHIADRLVSEFSKRADDVYGF
jgi:ribosome-associated toxin RatA of RatAB toxin-antitoxin module